MHKCTKLIPWCIIKGNPGKPDHISWKETSFSLSWFNAVVPSWDALAGWWAVGLEISMPFSGKVCSIEGPGLENFGDKWMTNAHYNWRHPAPYIYIYTHIYIYIYVYIYISIEHRYLDGKQRASILPPVQGDLMVIERDWEIIWIWKDTGY